MGQVLHKSARTTAAARRAIQHSQESLIVLVNDNLILTRLPIRTAI